MVKRKPTFIDIFAGAGGLSKGFQSAGFEHKLGVELDPKMAEAYRRNVGPVLVKDIRKVKGSDLPKVDVIVGGPPCQGFSPINLKVWNERRPDARQGLIFEFARIVSEAEPKAFLMENAASLSSKRFKGAYLEKFEKLLSRKYDVKCEVKDLGAMGGLRQNRKRTICVGTRKR